MNKILLLCSVLIWSQGLNAQVNILGKPGHILTPSAYWQEEKHFGVGFAYVPPPYGINRFMGTVDYAENIYSFRVAMTDFVELNLNITRIPALSDSIGIGDRHLDIRLKLLEEKGIRPALSVIVSAPFTVAPHLSHDVLVASKNFEMGTMGNLHLRQVMACPFILEESQRAEGQDFGTNLQLGGNPKQAIITSTAFSGPRFGIPGIFLE